VREQEKSKNIQTCMWVLIIAFPIKVARKNSQNGMPNCPHMMPARSNKGFGTWNKISINSYLQADKVYIRNAILEKDAPQNKRIASC